MHGNTAAVLLCKVTSLVKPGRGFGVGVGAGDDLDLVAKFAHAELPFR